MTLIPSPLRRHTAADRLARLRHAFRAAVRVPRLHRLRERYELWQSARRSREALDRLDARSLEDIGLRRTETGYESGPSTCERDVRLMRALGSSYWLWR
ncbi:DUF1127 domain-containing protein [Stappia sp.]|uniref:DUF1127 domain-containing protein n=1 Tax=Stappia sp. TaxID=1870903 RepID=UPI0032D8E14F